MYNSMDMINTSAVLSSIALVFIAAVITKVAWGRTTARPASRNTTPHPPAISGSSIIPLLKTYLRMTLKIITAINTTHSQLKISPIKRIKTLRRANTSIGRSRQQLINNNNNTKPTMQKYQSLPNLRNSNNNRPNTTPLLLNKTTTNVLSPKHSTILSRRNNNNSKIHTRINYIKKHTHKNT